MHLGSIYLVVRDFEKSISFYEKLLEIPVTFRNMNRFAGFQFEGNCISLMNGLFDAENPDKVVHKGEASAGFLDLNDIELAPNTQKFVLNFWDEDLRKEYERVRGLGISETLTPVKYVFNVAPYYYFHLTDPDGNVIEVTGDYTPEPGELE